MTGNTYDGYRTIEDAQKVVREIERQFKEKEYLTLADMDNITRSCSGSFGWTDIKDMEVVKRSNGTYSIMMPETEFIRDLPNPINKEEENNTEYEYDKDVGFYKRS